MTEKDDTMIGRGAFIITPVPKYHTQKTQSK